MAFFYTPVQEAYFGETPGIKELQAAIDNIRPDFIGKGIFCDSYHKGFSKIESALEKEFGFAGVDFKVVKDPSFNAFTYPVSKALDVGQVKSMKNLRKNVNSKGGV